jgi:hypothetical protein
LIAPDLADEVDVQEPVTVDVRDRQAGTVVVVGGLVRLSRIGDDSAETALPVRPTSSADAVATTMKSSEIRA